MSPVYHDIEQKSEFCFEHHKEMFPSVADESCQSMSQSVVHSDSVAEDDNNNGANLGAVLQAQEDAAMAEAHQNALLTESDHEEDDGPAVQHQNTHFIDRPGGMNDENADGDDMNELESNNNT